MEEHSGRNVTGDSTSIATITDITWNQVFQKLKRENKQIMAQKAVVGEKIDN